MFSHAQMDWGVSLRRHLSSAENLALTPKEIAIYLSVFKLYRTRISPRYKNWVYWDRYNSDYIVILLDDNIICIHQIRRHKFNVTAVLVAYYIVWHSNSKIINLFWQFNTTQMTETLWICELPTRRKRVGCVT